MSNDSFQKALQRKPQKTPPIWFMRQAGRYHSHYQALRKTHSFTKLCKNPKLAAEVALGPIETFDFDAAILFSDILFPLEALGMELEYNPGPKFSFCLDEAHLLKLKSPEKAYQDLLFQGEALKETRKALPESKSLIGFVGGPWTLFTYAMGSSKEDVNAKKNLSLVSKFNEIVLPLLEKNILLQQQSGAELVMIFDTSAGNLSPLCFQKFVFPSLKLLSSKFPKQLGYYIKTCSTEILKWISTLDFAGLGLDHRFYFPHQLLHHKKGFLQGNFDPALLFLKGHELEVQVQKYLNPFQKMPLEDRCAWVCGLGHGVLPQTPEENVKYFIKKVRESF